MAWYVGGARAYLDQIRRVESHGVHAGREIFLHKNINDLLRGTIVNRTYGIHKNLYI